MSEANANNSDCFFLSLLKKKNIIVQIGTMYPQSQNCAREIVIAERTTLTVILNLLFVRTSKQMKARDSVNSIFILLRKCSTLLGAVPKMYT